MRNSFGFADERGCLFRFSLRCLPSGPFDNDNSPSYSIPSSDHRNGDRARKFTIARKFSRSSMTLPLDNSAGSQRLTGMWVFLSIHGGGACLVLWRLHCANALLHFWVTQFRGGVVFLFPENSFLFHVD
jgi:hypothetical protein